MEANEAVLKMYASAAMSLRQLLGPYHRPGMPVKLSNRDRQLSYVESSFGYHTVLQSDPLVYCNLSSAGQDHLEHAYQAFGPLLALGIDFKDRLKIDCD